MNSLKETALEPERKQYEFASNMMLQDVTQRNREM